MNTCVVSLNIYIGKYRNVYVYIIIQANLENMQERGMCANKTIEDSK